MISPSKRFAAAACAAAIILAAPAGAQASIRLGAAPPLPAGAHLTTAVAPDTPLHVTVTLQPRDPAALEAFANQVSTPGSPLFRDYITPAEFAQRFGATPDAVQAVEASLEAHGLTPGAPSPNDLSIPVTATAGSLSRAFGVSLAHVVLPGGATAIVNQQAPALDSGVAGDVQAILGLDTLSKAKPLLVRAHAAGTVHAHVVTGGPQPCSQAAAEQSQGGLTDDQLASAYGLSGLYQAGDLGAGQTVAVLELEPYDPSDVIAYERCYGTNAQIANVVVGPGAGSGPGSGEAALDIENLIGLAPQARIAVYEGANSGPGPYDTFSKIINDHIAEVVTASWGQCEALNGASAAASENTLFQQAAAEGMTILSASGDSGSEDCSPDPPPTAQVDDPASQPYVTGVGGTRIASLGPRPAEAVWNDGVQVGASGGGVSTSWRMPSYQSGAPASLHVINSGSSSSTCGASSGYCREVPDVSADADPASGYVIYWNGCNCAGGTPAPTVGWQVVGGTSGAAPAWAALIALANASPACHGTSIGFANPALYNAAANNYGGYFNDITTGDNDMTGATLGQFAAGLGYDMATGLGSPNGTSLAAALCTDSIALSNPGAQRSILRTSVALQISAADTRGAPVAYRATGLPAGLSIDGSSGRITGRPQHVGTSLVTITVSDTAGTTAQTTFAWTVQGNPALSRVSLGSVGAAHPKLTLMIEAGRGAPQIKTISVALPRGLSFTRSRSTLTVTGVGGRRLKFSASLQRGTLVIKLRRTSPQVHLTIAYPRIKATGSLVAHHSARMTLTVRATDALKLTTKLSARIRPRS